VQYGVVEIDGQQYVERAQVFPADVNVTTNFQVLTQQRVTLPGVANFLLKGLTRETTAAGVSTAVRFKFRLGNSDGQTWYISGGVGASTDRAIDTAVFGSGQFPYPIIPPIPYSAGANIVFEIEDVSGSATATPYVINIAFHGAYLIPVGTAVPGSASVAGSSLNGYY
jgi:hypothetical protein